jgi:hypothetical protein
MAASTHMKFEAFFVSQHLTDLDEDFSRLLATAVGV